jgi:hypothetical protein
MKQLGGGVMASRRRVICRVLSRLVVAVGALLGAAATAQAQYALRVDPKQPSTAFASLDLATSRGTERTLVLRGIDWGLTSQVTEPRCGAEPLRVAGPAAWSVPPDCTSASWTVRFIDAEPGKVDASAQESVHLPGGSWWLLSDPTSLLRLQGDEASSTLTISFAGKPMAHLGATAADSGGWRVPSINNAPEFYVFGNLKSVEHKVDGFLVRHVADDLDRVQRLGLIRAQEDAWRYLTSIMPPPADTPARDRQLLIVWLGVRDRDLAGGAAGSRSFVANYFEQAEPLPQALTVTIMAHEQQHQLADMVRGSRPPLPVWVSESLAQYYGLRALTRSGLDPSAIAKVHSRYIDSARPVPAGLLEWQRRYDNGDAEAYPVFYQQGATFWALLDAELRKASGDGSGLDAFMPRLLTSEYEPHGQLPEPLVAQMRAVAGQRIDEILAKYVAP